MWAVAKIKLNEIALFRKQIEEKIGKDTIFYMPKTKQCHCLMLLPPGGREKVTILNFQQFLLLLITPKRRTVWVTKISRYNPSH